MKSIYMRFPNLNALLLILLLLTCLTALNKCAAQTIIDDDVLRYLLKRSQKAYYMEKDVLITDSIINKQEQIISNKDSIITNCGSKIEICELEKDFKNAEIATLSTEVRQLKRKAALLKFTTYLVGIVGSISTTYFIIH